MWSFASSVLRGKADGETEINDRSSNNVGSEEDDVFEETFEDCLEGDPEVSPLQSHTTQEISISSVYPPLSTIGAQPVPSHSSSFSRQAKISPVNFVQHFESISHQNAICSRELNFRPGNGWNYSADDSSTDISYRQDLWEDSSVSTTPVRKRGLFVSTPEDGNGSNASSAHGSSQIHRTPTAIPREEFKSADRRYSESGPWSSAFSSSPPRVDNGQPLSMAGILNERGSPPNSCGNGVSVRLSPWSNVKCGVRARGSGAIHPLAEDWSSFNEFLYDASQDGHRLATPPSQPITGGSFWEERSPSQTCCSPTANILQSQISLGACPLINSPNCTVDRDSRHLSKLRFPQQCQGVNESSEKTAFDPVSFFGNISLHPQLEERRQRQSYGGRSVQWPQLTEHLSVLGNFEFSTKVYPVLTRLKGRSLEESFSLEELSEIGGLPKEKVSQYLWYLDGLYNRPTDPQTPKRDAGASSVFRCTVHRTGKVTYHIDEEKNQTSTVLQRELGFDRLLKVFFEDERGGQVPRAQYEAYHRIAENGIFVGLRRYQYFAHKPSEKSDHKSEGNVKCYFVCTESKADADLQDPQFKQFPTVADVRCLFMHIHTTDSLSKYNSRLQLVLSKTATVNLDWSVVNIEDIDDVRCKDASGQELQGVCTDGTGFISIDLAKKIDTNIYKGRRLRKRSSTEIGEEGYPSIVQVRLFQDGVARKGTLAANAELPPNTIRCYTSMVKVRRDNRVRNNSLTSLEVVSTSLKTTGKAKLSQDLVVLLSLCKVPEAFFMGHLTAAMEKSYLIFSDPRAALEELLDWENDKADLLADMISAKISLQEPFLQRSLVDMSKSKRQDFTKGRFALDGTHNLMATADPTGTLKRNQVTITLSEGPVYCSKVLVYRAPGKHPGDIHVFQATCNERLEAAIDTGKYAIYFSTQGSRPITEEIGKGDLDGDRYWVCKNPELVSYFREWHCRWERSPTKIQSMPKPAEFSPDELERSLFDQFLQARYNMTSLVGKTANRWLMHMDEHLHIKDEYSEKKWAHLEAALKLPSPYYDSLDYAKTGTKPLWPDERLHARRPHHMEKQVEGVGLNSNSYHSESILGKMYDKAVSSEHKWCPPSYDNFEVDSGFQIANHELHLKRWQEHFTSYRGEMSRAMKAKTAGSHKLTDPEKIYLKYRKILYGGCSSFKKAEVLGKKERRLILEEASAIYAVVYETGKYYVSRGWEPKLSFAWNVAGEALCEIYSKRQPGRSLHLSFDYFKEIFERNKSKHDAPLSPELFSCRT